MDEQPFETIKQKLRTRWPEVQAIAAKALASETITNLLATVGGPSTVEELGLPSVTPATSAPASPCASWRACWTLGGADTARQRPLLNLQK